MKANLSRVLRSGIAMLLAICLVVGFVPAAAFATEGEINYVSLGDSMTNGYCFTGYNQGNISPAEFLDGTGVYGGSAYPNEFAAWLEAETGKTVNHSKLAVSAMRAEDLNYLLGGREMPTDGWFSQVEDYSGTSGDALKGIYQDAITNADVITMGIGNAAFGAYMVQYFTRMLGVMGGSLPDEEKVDLEKALINLDDEQKAVILEAYDKMVAEAMAYIPADANLGPIADKVEDLIDMMAYIGTGYILNIEGVLDQIVELNPDVEIVLIGLMNTTYGMRVTGEGFDPIPIGDLVDIMFDALNAYTAALPAVNQELGKWTEAKFYYTDMSNPEFIVQVYDDLYELGWPDDLNGLSGKTVRARTVKAYNNNLREMISAALRMDLPAVSVEEVASYVFDTSANDHYQATIEVQTGTSEFWKGSLIAQIMTGAPAAAVVQGAIEKEISIAIYLALEEALAKSVNSMDITLDGLLGITGDVFTALGQMPDELNPANNPGPGTINEALVGWFTGSATGLAMCKVFAMFKVGDGMSVHPTPAAHANTADAVIAAYKNKHTTKEETLKNLQYALDELLKVIETYGPDALEEAYKYAEENGYIDMLEQAIKDTNAWLKEHHDSVIIPTLEAQLEALEAQLEELKAQLKALNEELLQKKAELENAAEELAAKIEAAIAELEALIAEVEAKIAEIEVAIEELKAELAQLQKNIAALAEAVKDLEKAVIELKDALKAGSLDIAKKAAAAAREAAVAAYEAIVTLNEQIVNGLKKVEGLYEKVVELVNTLNNYVTEKLNAIAALVGNVADESIQAAIDAIKAELEKAIAAVENGLVEQIAALTAQFEEKIAAAQAALAEKLAQIDAEIAAKVAELNEKAAAQIAAIKAEVEAKIAEIEAAIAEKQAQLAELYAALENASEEAKAKIEKMIAEVEAAIAELNAQLEAAKAALEAKIAELEACIAEKQAKLAELYAALENATEEVKAQIEKQIAEVEAAIAELKAELEAAKAELEAKIAEIKACIAEKKAQLAKLYEDLKNTSAEVKAQIEKQIATVEAALNELNAQLMAAKAELEAKIAEVKAQVEKQIATVINKTLEHVDAKLQELLASLDALIDEQIQNLLAQAKAALIRATTADLMVESEFKYVALGDGSAAADGYAEALNAMLEEKALENDVKKLTFVNAAKVGNTVAAEAANLTADVADADLITLGFSQTEMLGNALKALLAGETSFDWTALVGEEGLPYVEKAMEAVNAEIAALELDATNAAQLSAIFEAYAYSVVEYAVTLPQLIKAIRAVNTDAVVMVVGMYNPIEGVVIDAKHPLIGQLFYFELGQFSEYFDYLIHGSRAYGVAFAMLTDEIDYVDASEVAVKTPTMGLQDFLDLTTYGDVSALYPSAEGADYIAEQIAKALNLTFKPDGLWGDANGDGKVLANDAMLVLRYSVGAISADKLNLPVCDVDGNGQILASDAMMILRHSVGALPVFPVEQ